MWRLLPVLVFLAACGDGGTVALDCDGADASDPRCQVVPPPGGGGPEPPDEEGAVLHVTLGNGDRRVVSDNATGDGPSFQVPFGGSHDVARGRLLVIDKNASRPRVLAVDLASRDRTVLSDENTGTGPDLEEPVAVAVDGDRALVLDRGAFALLAVDLASGDRSVVSNGATGAGPLFGQLGALALDAGRAFVGQRNGAGIVVVDLATGDRAVLSDDDVGTGPDLEDIHSLALDPPRNRLLVLHRNRDIVLAVDLSTGNRTQIIGTGPALVGPLCVVVDPVLDRALITTKFSVYSVDLPTGDRTLVSGDLRGTGPRLKAAWAAVFDASDTAFALIVDSGGSTP
jgi:hypothetical protein